MIAALVAGFRFQLAVLRRAFGDLVALVTAPLMTLVFLAITRHAGRDDLAPYAVLAPALIVLWTVSLIVAGELITRERENASLEALIATPVSFASVITGRIAAVVLLSLVGFAESWLAAWLTFGVVVPVHHPVAFVATLLVTAAAMAGTASVMSALFVLARSARAFQNSLNYPFYVLGGVMVPVSFLPGWVEPVSRAVFLSWSADLLRDAMTPAAVPQLLPRLAMVLALGLAGYGLGLVLLRGAVNRLRRTGSLSYA
ncbi:ABC transporter permease [Natronosporangium hydrolyticum]|uniref:ABC transporter permease n=1 Tax=Natronosporangium hydrolyticum TaxID=2811111 RepID=A0A895YB81_9ACTN|nr:ABC transporter permease [Natronosporangium hydrolyticum]QSB15007.1 ABC transporter permease [Natronosporangium hydrolyticum]